MKKIENETYVGERCLFNSSFLDISNSTFLDGESPLKESSNISLNNCSFKWKYPLWYCNNVTCNNVKLFETARSGIWYTKNIVINDSIIDAPKTFRRAKHIVLNNVTMNNALESFWNCKDIKLNKITAKGDYFGMNSTDIVVENFHLDGNYAFDGGKNIVVKNSTMNSKDAFWNCKNVRVENSFINGEYLGWNTSDITFVNCKIISHQGFCYMKNVKLINCELIDSDLCFEYCKDIDASLNSTIMSVKNPFSGIIRAKSIGELILDATVIDPHKTKIITNE